MSRPDGADSAARREARQRGLDAEMWVARTLAAQGWRVVARNWRGGGAELDLVVRRHDALRFVEVKARSPSDDIGLEVITEGKRRRLVRGAEAFLAQWDEAVSEACFAVAFVTVAEDGMRLEWLDDAFDG